MSANSKITGKLFQSLSIELVGLPDSPEKGKKETIPLVAQKEQNGENLLHTPVDGKVMRGTLKHGRDDQPPVHLFSFKAKRVKPKALVYLT